MKSYRITGIITDKNILDFFSFFQKNFNKWKKYSKHKFEVRTVLFEVGIVLGILKKSYLKLAILF